MAALYPSRGCAGPGRAPKPGLGLIKILSQAHWVGPGWAWVGLGLSPGLYIGKCVSEFIVAQPHTLSSHAIMLSKGMGGMFC